MLVIGKSGRILICDATPGVERRPAEFYWDTGSIWTAPPYTEAESADSRPAILHTHPKADRFFPTSARLLEEHSLTDEPASRAFEACMEDHVRSESVRLQPTPPQDPRTRCDPGISPNNAHPPIALSSTAERPRHNAVAAAPSAVPRLRHARKASGIVLLARFLGAAQRAAADELWLMNGDHMTGTTQALEGGVLTFKPGYADAVKVAWRNVVGLQAQRPSSASFRPSRGSSGRGGPKPAS
jgi:hypothetical protein